MIRLQRARLWTLVWMLGFAGPALAQEASDALQPRRFQPNAYAGMKIGNERIIGQFGFLGPIVQSRNSLVFMDLRGRVDDQTSGEGNFGLGVRHVFGDRRFVGGAYGYFDILRSAQSNTFVQGTFGLEFSSEHWMARGNAYIPEDRDQVISYLGGPEGPQFVGTTIKIVRGLGKAVVERPLIKNRAHIGNCAGNKKGTFSVTSVKRLVEKLLFPLPAQNGWRKGTFPVTSAKPAVWPFPWESNGET